MQVAGHWERTYNHKSAFRDTVLDLPPCPPPSHSQCPCLQAYAQACTLSDRTCVSFHSLARQRGNRPVKLVLTQLSHAMRYWRDAGLGSFLGERQMGAWGRIWACPSNVISFGPASTITCLVGRVHCHFLYVYGSRLCTYGCLEWGRANRWARQVVSGQYCHGPVSPNIIWALNCVLCLLDSSRDDQVREQGKKNPRGWLCESRGFEGWSKMRRSVRNRKGHGNNEPASSGVFGLLLLDYHSNLCSNWTHLGSRPQGHD